MEYSLREGGKNLLYLLKHKCERYSGLIARFLAGAEDNGLVDFEGLV